MSRAAVRGTAPGATVASMKLTRTKTSLGLLTAIALSIGASTLQEDAAPAAPAASRFSRDIIDLGIVVTDLERSARFYTEALGFVELDGFSVDAEFCTDSGLTDMQPLTIRVFATTKDDDATHVKLMEVPAAKPAAGRNEFIHSQLGYRYLSVFVKDIDAAHERLDKAGVKPLAKSPVAIGNGSFLTLVQDPDGNRVELIGRRAR